MGNIHYTLWGCQLLLRCREQIDSGFAFRTAFRALKSLLRLSNICSSQTQSCAHAHVEETTFMYISYMSVRFSFFSMSINNICTDVSLLQSSCISGRLAYWPS